MITKKCELCKKEFKTYPSLKRKFCSKVCYSQWQIGKHLSPNTEFKNGKKLSEKQRIKISKRLKGKSTWNKGRKMTDYPQCGWQKNSILNQGKNNPMWNGGRRYANGYILIYKPEHPFNNINKCVFEHRLIAEKILGRYLTNIETIHHINEIKDDNRPKNLYLFSTGGRHTYYHNLLKYNKIKPITESNLV